MYKKLSIAICAVVAFATTIQPAVSAAAFPEPYILNTILFFKKNDATCSGSSADSVSGANNQEKIWGYLRRAGLSSEQAAGVMGNIQAESGFSPTRHENSQGWGNGGWGLAQWTGDRRNNIIKQIPAELVKYYRPEYGGPAKEDGTLDSIPIEDNDKLLIFELKYLIEESKNRPVTLFGLIGRLASFAGLTEWEMLKQTQTIEEATVFWHNNFEVSADSAEKVLLNRGGFAKDIYDKYNGTGGNDENCPTSGGSIQEYTKKYAHPDSVSRQEQMPDYAKAVSTAKSEGRYTGACEGNDCGGFVTTILHDSGFDPTYNHGGKIAEGAGYTAVQRAWAEANWQTLGNGSSINVADLQPGDVAHSPGHTFIYVGKIDGFNSLIASASMCEYAPKAGLESITSPSVTWFRKGSNKQNKVRL